MMGETASVMPAETPAQTSVAVAVPHPALYLCRVFHARKRPFRHAFRYAIYSLLLDIDRLDDLPWPLRHNHFGLLAFHDRDHGPRDGSPLRPWVETTLLQAGLAFVPGTVMLLAMPRAFGYAFNPLSVYYCHDLAGNLQALIYEVKNTFGDQHCYVQPLSKPLAPDSTIRQEQTKAFHVSPFFDIEGRYKFRLSVPGDRLLIDIRYCDTEGELMSAIQQGERRPLTSGHLWKVILRYPLMTFKVIAGIHWQALQVWRKGARFHARPEPPTRTAAVGSGPGASSIS
jgi:uncharacterized protein